MYSRKHHSLILTNTFPFLTNIHSLPSIEKFSQKAPVTHKYLRPHIISYRSFMLISNKFCKCQLYNLNKSGAVIVDKI